MPGMLVTDPEELCCAVVERASGGPCVQMVQRGTPDMMERCGHDPSMVNLWVHGPLGHAYLGPPSALCGRTYAETLVHWNPETGEEVARCGVYPEGHEYVPGRPCPTCGGSTRLLEQGDVVGPLGSCPNPDCVLGYVPGSELSLRG